MKKLMIAAAIVCAAVVSQAASISWQFAPAGTLKDGYGKAAGSYTPVALAGASVYLIDAATSQTALLTALNGGASISSYVMKDSSGNAVAAAVTGSDGKVANDATVYFTKTMDVGDTLSAYAAVIEVDGDNTFVYLSATKTADALDEAQTSGMSPALGLSTNYKGLAKNGFSAAGWYQLESVPEPTSGLLLLLGMAGLALKRKRA